MRRVIVNKIEINTNINQLNITIHELTNSKNEGGILSNKAFTLIELLGVIIVLAIIALIVVPIIDNTLKNTRQRAYEIQVEQIENAAKEYSVDHEEILPMNDGVFTNQVMLSDLVTLGYIEKDGDGKVYNPIDNSVMNGCVNIKFDLEYNQYTYIYDNECLPQTVINYNNYYINYGGAYNDAFNKGIVTSDGEYIAVGSTNSQNIVGLESNDSTINTDALIVKFDASGNVIWQDTFGGSNTDYFSDVIEVEENSQKFYIVVGYSMSIDGDFSDSNIENEYQKPVILKYDEYGNVVEKKVFMDGGIIYNIKKIDGGYIAVGNINNDTYKDEIYDKRINDYNGYGDAIIMKLNNSFEVVWSSYFGGTNDEIFREFIITSFGYVVVGQGRSLDGDMSDIYVDTAAYVYDGIIVSYDKSGNLLNKEAFGSSANDSFANLIEFNNSYIVVGYAGDNDLDLADTGKSGAIIVKYDKNLNFEKYTVLENNNSNDFRDIILDNDRIIVVGNIFDNNLYSDGVILEINENLNIIKQKKFKGINTDNFNSIVKKDNNYIVFGGTYSKGKSIYDTLDPYLKGNQDAILLSYDENFNLTKIFNKKVDTELIPKEVVKNYGTSIPSYENKDSLKLYTTNNPNEDIAVFEKYGDLFAFEHISRKSGTIQPGTRDVHLFQEHVALFFKQHKIIVRAELLFDVVHTVDLRKPAFENGDLCRVNRFLRSRGFELCEDPCSNVVIIDRTVDFDKLRGRVFVHIIQHLRKGGDPPVLFGLVKESKLNGADGQHGTQILPVINYAVLTYFVERYKQRSVAVLCALFVFFSRRKIAQYVNQLVIGTLTVVWEK